MSLDRDPGTPPLYGVAPQRTPVLFDAESRGLRIGSYEQRIDDPDNSDQVFAAYLSLLYAVRGASPGQELKLRSADIEALLLIVGDDPDAIEQRLIGLMGCTPEEAKVLGGALLRHRRLTATLGIAASLALGGAVAVDADRSDTPVRQDVTRSVAPVASSELPAAPEPFVGPVAAPSAVAPASSGARSLRVVAAPTTVEVTRPVQRPVAVAPDRPAAPVPAAAPAATDPLLAPPATAPAAVVVQAPPVVGVVMDAPPPVEDPLEGAIEIGDAVSMDHGSSFAPPAPDTTVAEPPVLHLPVIDVVIAPPASDDAPVTGGAADAPAGRGVEPPHDNRDGELKGNNGGAQRGGPAHAGDGAGDPDKG